VFPCRAQEKQLCHLLAWETGSRTPAKLRPVGGHVDWWNGGSAPATVLPRCPDGTGLVKGASSLGQHPPSFQRLPGIIPDFAVLDLI
jgi:hypothetical protein